MTARARVRGSRDVTRLVAVLALALLGSGGCAVAPRAAGKVVAPGELFSGSYINVRAPSTEGWRLMESSGSGMAFGKSGRTSGESFIATASMFSLAPTATPEEFETLIKSAVENDTDRQRFDVQQASLKYTGERPYPCVRYESVATDRTPPGAKTPLLLEIDALYCRHPVRQDTGFAAIYSHRGASRHAGLRGEAERFIQGVQVPGH